MAIPRGKPEPEAIKVIERPPTETVFMMRSAKYRDAAGMMRTARQYDDAEMPVQTAQRALRLGVAAPVTDPRRRKLKGARGGDPVDPRAIDIVDLGDEVATRPSQIASVTSDPHANFIVLDRSAEKAFKQERVADAVGETSRFLALQKEYEKAPDVTRTRLYLEAMEKILSKLQLYIIDSDKGRVPCI